MDGGMLDAFHSLQHYKRKMKRHLIEHSSYIKTNRRASALVEVLLVVAAIGIICGLLIPTTRNITQFEDSNNPLVAVASNIHSN